MILALDIGNTQITMGVFKKDKLLFISRLHTDKLKTPDQYAADIKAIIDINGVDISSVDASILCSVVPHLTIYVSRAIKKLTGLDTVTVESGLDAPIKTKENLRSQMGGDLAVSAVAAINLYSYPAIVADIGTATTLLVIDNQGCTLGGVIAPGPVISLNALTERSALIPSIDIKAPDKIICEDSVGALQSGIVAATAAMLDGMCLRIEEELGYKCDLIITGGLSHIIAPLCKRDYILDENLLLEGLRILYHEKTKG